MEQMKWIAAAMAAAALALASAPAAAHGDAAHRTGASAPLKKEQQDWGIAGDARQARRTIAISMGDDMRFSPSDIHVDEGETVRFVVSNRGRMLHEMVIGNDAALKEHAALMRKFPNMQHDEAHMVHVEPGTRETLVWHFNRPGQFGFACLVAGHYEAGMVGRITVAAARKGMQ